MPDCPRCGRTFFNFQGKHECQPGPRVIWRGDPDGFRVSAGWGANVNRPVIRTLPPQPRHGSLTEPEENHE